MSTRGVIRIADDRYLFECPGCGCFHWFKTEGEDGKWIWDGDYEKPTITPSIRVIYEENIKECHFVIIKGIIRFTNDTFHELKGREIEMKLDYESNN